MDKKIKAFFAAMGIDTALLVSVSASADNSDSKCRHRHRWTAGVLPTDGQWDPVTTWHSMCHGWSDSYGNLFSDKLGTSACYVPHKQAEGMDEIKAIFHTVS